MNVAAGSRMSMRKEYETKVEGQLTAWSAELEAFKSHGGELLETGFAAASAEWEAALVKLAELKVAAGGRWGVLKAELEAACHRVGAAVAPFVRRDVETDVEEAELEASTRITERNMKAVVPEGEPPPAG